MENHRYKIIFNTVRKINLKNLVYASGMLLPILIYRYLLF